MLEGNVGNVMKPLGSRPWARKMDRSMRVSKPRKSKRVINGADSAIPFNLRQSKNIYTCRLADNYIYEQSLVFAYGELY